MKLRSKINLYTTVMFICLLIVINTAIYLSFSHMMYSSELERTKAEALKMSRGITQSGSSIQPNTLLRAYVPINGMLRIVRSDGKAISSVTAPGKQDLLSGIALCSSNLARCNATGYYPGINKCNLS
ncbi:hypothetical protein ACIQ7N_20410 [Lysinibacillus sp. NPDC095746]|uniref:hypothetical protein n=1 Tax=Lysinibacillus sp. NPDC095746 TaxID=3364134 RepID=UPI0037F52323